MTRQEADALCAQLGNRHPDRLTHRWFPRQMADGEWEVVKVPGEPEGDRHNVPTSPGKAERPPRVDDGKLPGGISPWAVG